MQSAKTNKPVKGIYHLTDQSYNMLAMSNSSVNSSTQTPLYLMVDTSTKNCSVAIAKASGIIHCQLWQTAYNPTSELLPNIISSLSHMDLTLSRMSGIGVAIGPGGFSSIRTGISVVKGLTMGSGIPAVGFNTLEATAYQYMAMEKFITPVLAIGKGYFAWADYQVINLSLRLIGNQKVGSQDDMLAGKHSETYYCGEGVPILFENVDASLVKDSNVLPYHPEDRINGLTQMVISYFSQNPGKSNHLNPIYLKEPSIGKKNS